MRVRVCVCVLSMFYCNIQYIYYVASPRPSPRDVFIKNILFSSNFRIENSNLRPSPTYCYIGSNLCIRGRTSYIANSISSCKNKGETRIALCSSTYPNNIIEFMYTRLRTFHVRPS